jgi:hypothetical protein
VIFIIEFRKRLLSTYGQFNMSQWIKKLSEFEKHHASRLPHPPYSPETSPCDFWFFGMLNGVLKDREFYSSDAIEEAITKVWDELTFDEVQSVFRNWTSRRAWVIENEENTLLQKSEMASSHVVNLKIGGDRNFLYTL